MQEVVVLSLLRVGDAPFKKAKKKKKKSRLLRYRADVTGSLNPVLGVFTFFFRSFPPHVAFLRPTYLVGGGGRNAMPPSSHGCDPPATLD